MRSLTPAVANRVKVSIGVTVKTAEETGSGDDFGFELVDSEKIITEISNKCTRVTTTTTTTTIGLAGGEKNSGKTPIQEKDHLGDTIIKSGKMKNKTFSEVAGSNDHEHLHYKKWLRSHTSQLTDSTLLELVGYLTFLETKEKVAKKV